MLCVTRAQNAVGRFEHFRKHKMTCVVTQRGRSMIKNNHPLHLPFQTVLRGTRSKEPSLSVP